MARGKTSLRAYGNKRDASEAAIVTVLRMAGCSVIRMDKPVDLLVLHHKTSRVHLVEVKAAKGRLTASQQELIDEHWPVYIIRTVDDALAALKAWGSSQARAA